MSVKRFESMQAYFTKIAQHATDVPVYVSEPRDGMINLSCADFLRLLRRGIEHGIHPTTAGEKEFMQALLDAEIKGVRYVFDIRSWNVLVAKKGYLHRVQSKTKLVLDNDEQDNTVYCSLADLSAFIAAGKRAGIAPRSELEKDIVSEVARLMAIEEVKAIADDI